MAVTMPRPDYEFDKAYGKTERRKDAAAGTLDDFLPSLDYVLVRPQTPDAKTAGGIILPVAAEEKPVEGRALYAGPGVYQNGVFVENQVKPGMWVRFGEWASTAVRIGNETFIIMRESDIIGTRPSRKVTQAEALAGK